MALSVSAARINCTGILEHDRVYAMVDATGSLAKPVDFPLCRIFGSHSRIPLGTSIDTGALGAPWMADKVGSRLPGDFSKLRIGSTYWATRASVSVSLSSAGALGALL
jgi:hypothetical protein